MLEVYIDDELVKCLLAQDQRHRMCFLRGDTRQINDSVPHLRVSRVPTREHTAL